MTGPEYIGNFRRKHELRMSIGIRLDFPFIGLRSPEEADIVTHWIEAEIR